MSLTDGIVGCWSPSLGASGYRLLDRSGRGNHGTLNNMDAGTDWVGTPVGLGLDFDGSNDRISASAAAVQGLTAVTLNCWVYARSTSAAVLINATPTNSIFNLLLFSGSLIIRGGSLTGVSATYNSTNAWQMVTGTIRGTTGTLYLGGVQVATGTVSAIGTAPTGIDLACYSDFGAGYFLNGILGETAIYNRALTAGEVLDLYRRGNGAIGRELTGQTRRRSYGFVAAVTGARRRRILCGDYS